MASATESTVLLRTPLADWHADHGGRLVDFAGWSMPVQYGSIVDEHNATRSQAGLFDVSHMGRFSVNGPDAAALLDRLLTRRVSKLKAGAVRYALVCNEAGGVLDDVLATRIAEERYALVVNASNREKLWAWFTAHAGGLAVELDDRTTATAMIAVQGPAAVRLVAERCDADVAAMRYYTATTATVAETPAEVSRTGYTGEDGFELVCDARHATRLWQTLVEAGARPCGLAARDTLRLEAGMPLYGHELTEDTTPLHAGLSFAVNLVEPDGSPRSFVGGDSLRKVESDVPTTARVGLLVEGKRPPRENYPVLVDGQPCGVVTSGTHSPTLGQPIAMAYVEPTLSGEDTPLAVDIRGVETPARVTALPFYRRG